MKFKQSTILDSIDPARKVNWQPLMRRRRSETVQLRDFSFIDHPDETLECLRRLSVAEGRAIQARLDFSDVFCRDIGAFLVLEACWGDLGPVFLGGAIFRPTRKVLEAVGLRSALGIAPFASKLRADDITPFPIQRSRDLEATTTTSLIDPERSEKVSNLLCDWINRVLGEAADLELSDEGMRRLEMITGEALDNAETHGDEHEKGSWTIAGFMARRSGQFRFHLAFLSVGSSIAESLENPPESIRRGMEAYIQRHRGKRTNLSEGDLRTVYALQDGVTRLERKLEGGPGRRKGGTGLADMIEFFSELAGGGGVGPRLAIVSGSTYIRIAPPYGHVLREGNDAAHSWQTAPRRIWFNQANTEMEPPDAAYVFSMMAPVRGTLVTMAFNLDAKYLSGNVDGDDRPDRTDKG